MDENYLLKLKLNKYEINQVIITDYYSKKHSDITEELILELVKMLTDERDEAKEFIMFEITFPTIINCIV